MHRWFALLVGILTTAAVGLGPAAATAGATQDTPIGNIGDTLRVNYEGIIADVTVHNILPTDPPPGYVPTGSPRWRYEGGPWKALVTIHTLATPTPHSMVQLFSFTGVTPYADAYEPKNTDAADDLRAQLLNAPAGSTVNGSVYWQVYRDYVTNVVLLEPRSGQHLAQWNISPPGAPLP